MAFYVSLQMSTANYQAHNPFVPQQGGKVFSERGRNLFSYFQHICP